MSADYIEIGDLAVAPAFRAFVEEEALPSTGLEPTRFWQGLSSLLADFASRNRSLLSRRDTFQSKIDAWHRINRSKSEPSTEAQRQFLHEIGYLVPEGPDFRIETESVAPEISILSGPQLVVPLSNSRYALNAVNARWGSLYDALYGSDVIADHGATARTTAYNPVRGAQVIQRARAFLDLACPLVYGSHSDAVLYAVEAKGLSILLGDGTHTAPANPATFVGFRGPASTPSSILLRHNGLHVEIAIDPTHVIGARDPAGIADVIVEAALTTILDLEDSVAAVDAEDKVQIYRNMLEIMRGTLSAQFEKSGRPTERTLAPDRIYATPAGGMLRLSGRSLMLFRNVGNHMMSDIVLMPGGDPIPEGILDGAMTAALAHHALKSGDGTANTQNGSIYIVKPKIHGPEEAAFVNDLFDALEDFAGHRRHTLKIGLMDEERRTSLNLKECIRAVRSRIVFINTGFLDRTGDEIHTAMHAGPLVRKAAMKAQRWYLAYEENNVIQGLRAGFSGRAQIGKGMWAMPDRMAEMLATKAAQLRAGASTAWVPSPTAATLHALHYHEVDVPVVQAALARRPAPDADDLLMLSRSDRHFLSATDLSAELDNNCQSILGYVVRWIDQGVGCSKVPDIHNIGLMEDRATLRISSQILANWLLHGVCSSEQICEALERMADVVDMQNRNDPLYRPMTARSSPSIAFLAARALIFEGAQQPNGYTENLLHAYRRMNKSAVPPAG